MIGILINIAIFGALAWVGYCFYVAFTTNTGTVKEKLLKAGHDSAVIVLQYFTIAANGIITLVGSLVGIFADPSTVATVQSYLPSEWVRGFLLVMAAITILARFRTLQAPS